MICILAIGNSFSQDATYYLHQIAAADQVEMKVANLYIGGCSLERHWENICSDAADYLYELNGQSQERHVSVREALEEDAWDIIVTQQASHDSGWADTYEPFLSSMVEYIGKLCPAARILLHKTWAYELDSTHEKFVRYHKDQREMYDRLSAAYKAAAERVGIPMIPGGDVIQALRREPPFQYERGGMSLCRDGFHMSWLYGRYAVAAAWYGTITGRALTENSYVPETTKTDEKAQEELIGQIRRVVDGVLESQQRRSGKPAV